MFSGPADLTCLALKRCRDEYDSCGTLRCSLPCHALKLQDISVQDGLRTSAKGHVLI